MHKHLLLLALIFAPQLAEAATITVDDSGGRDYTTIQAAVDAASSGDLIVVYAGDYEERVVINRSGLSELKIKANGSDVVTITNPGANHDVIYAQNVNLKIKNITIIGNGETSPPEVGITARSVTGAGSQAFETLVCDVTFDGNSIQGGSAIRAVPSDTDAITGWGWTSSTITFDEDILGTFPGWSGIHGGAGSDTFATACNF